MKAIQILGDDKDGAHSTGIIVGQKTVIGCAHSLTFQENISNIGVKTRGKAKKFIYLEDYWIQPSLTKNADGRITFVNRVQLKLFKFQVSNDWAIFRREDGLTFDDSMITEIEYDHVPIRPFQDAILLHFPVSLQSIIMRQQELSLSCQASFVHIQTAAQHHLKYEAKDVCRGSSGDLYILIRSL